MKLFKKLLAAVIIMGIAYAPAQVPAQSGRLKGAEVLEQKIEILEGLCFSPYVRGNQSAEKASKISEAQIKELIEQIAPLTKSIRTYGMLGDLAQIPKIAKQYGLHVVAGIWVSDDGNLNKKALDNVIANIKHIDAVCVGNETQNLGTATIDTLKAFMKETRTALDKAGYAHIPITTNETLEFWHEYPELAEYCTEEIFISYHPYFGSADDYYTAATEYLPDAINQAVEIADKYGKKAVLGEVGWPSYHSLEQAQIYITTVALYAAQHDVKAYIFSSHDEEWKIDFEGKAGGTWGLLTAEGKHKYPAMFKNGPVDPPPPPPPPPSQPSVTVTKWPNRNDMTLAGTVSGGKNVDDYCILIWIHVPGSQGHNAGWWPKPTYANLTTRINKDGTFKVNVKSHSNDVNLDQTMVLLVPKTYKPDGKDFDADKKAAVFTITD